MLMVNILNEILQESATFSSYEGIFSALLHLQWMEMDFKNKAHEQFKSRLYSDPCLVSFQ